MTLFLVLFTSIVVWLNRGLYDPSVPILIALFLMWAYGVVADKRWFPVGIAQKINEGWIAIPFFWAILFIFRNDFLYVPGTKQEAVQMIRFFPLMGLTIYVLSRYAGMQDRKIAEW